MNVSAYSSFIEIMTGLNLGFAGIPAFRRAIEEEIFYLSRTLSDNIQKQLFKFQGELFVNNSEAGETETDKHVEARVAAIRRDFDGRCAQLAESERAFREFSEGLKPVFLTGGLIGLLCLLIAGTYDYFGESSIVPNIILCFVYPCMLLYSYLIYRNSLKRSVAVNVKPTYLIISLVISIIASATCSQVAPIRDWLSDSTATTAVVPFALCAVLIPYVAFIMRSLLHKAIFRSKFFLLGEKTNHNIQCTSHQLLAEFKDAVPDFSKMPKFTFGRKCIVVGRALLTFDRATPADLLDSLEESNLPWKAEINLDNQPKLHEIFANGGKIQIEGNVSKRRSRGNPQSSGFGAEVRVVRVDLTPRASPEVPSTNGEAEARESGK